MLVCYVCVCVWCACGVCDIGVRLIVGPVVGQVRGLHIHALYIIHNYLTMKNLYLYMIILIRSESDLEVEESVYQYCHKLSCLHIPLSSNVNQNLMLLHCITFSALFLPFFPGDLKHGACADRSGHACEHLPARDGAAWEGGGGGCQRKTCVLDAKD